MPPLATSTHPLGQFYEAAQKHILKNAPRYLKPIGGRKATVDTVYDDMKSDGFVGSEVGQISQGAAYHIAFLIANEQTTQAQETAPKKRKHPTKSKTTHHVEPMTAVQEMSKKEKQTEKNRRRNTKKRQKRKAAKFAVRRAREAKQETTAHTDGLAVSIHFQICRQLTRANGIQTESVIEQEGEMQREARQPSSGAQEHRSPEEAEDHQDDEWSGRSYDEWEEWDGSSDEEAGVKQTPTPQADTPPTTREEIREEIATPRKPCAENYYMPVPIDGPHVDTPPELKARTRSKYFRFPGDELPVSGWEPFNDEMEEIRRNYRTNKPTWSVD